MDLLKNKPKLKFSMIGRPKNIGMTEKMDYGIDTVEQFINSSVLLVLTMFQRVKDISIIQKKIIVACVVTTVMDVES
jgi:hypothetical protein